MIQYKWNQDKLSTFQVYQLKQQNFHESEVQGKYQDWAYLYFLYQYSFINETLDKYVDISIVTQIKQEQNKYQASET